MRRLLLRPCKRHQRHIAYRCFFFRSNQTPTLITTNGSKENSKRVSQISNALARVIEKNINQNLISMSALQEIKVFNDNVNVTLDLLVPGHPHKNKIITECESMIYKEASWVKSVDFNILSEEFIEDLSAIQPPMITHTCNSKSSSSSSSLSLSSSSHTHTHSHPPTETTTDVNINLKGIKNIIAVSSCKGGVGKSTVAVNLAFTLARRGLKIGLLDGDIYGPSLPYMVTPIDTTVRRSRNNPKFILPLTAAVHPVEINLINDTIKNINNNNDSKSNIDHVNTNSTTTTTTTTNQLLNEFNSNNKNNYRNNNSLTLKMLSFGHVNPRAGVEGAGGQAAAVIRGPVASKVITQMVVATEWGQLDYLVVDMPPGTGDVQITLSQCLSFTGAVIVTTPHALSLVDAAKGVAMFQRLQIPTLALVENMSYFTCRHGERYFPFGVGGRENLLRGLKMHALDRKNNNDSDSDKNSQKNNNSSSVTSSSSSFSPSPPSLTTSTSNTATTTTTTTSIAMDRLSVCPLHALPLSPSIAASSSSVNMNTQEVDDIYSALADDVILEIYKLKQSTQSFPIVSYSSERKEIILREVTATSAVEYRLLAVELRVRDPYTGSIYTDPIKSNRQKYMDSAAIPIKFDLKGNYGVAINWSDGHYADIFPYEVLRKIANEIKESSGTYK